MNIRVVTDIILFKSLLGDWSRLFILGEYSVFQSFEFNYYSWKTELSNDPKNRLCIVLLEDDAKIYAIFPLYIDSISRVRFINDNHADFCDCISSKTINFRVVYDYLRSQFSFQSIQLINLKRESRLYDTILCLNNLNKVIRLGSEYSTLNIEKGSYPYNVKHYRSHQKHRINKAHRKYRKMKSVILHYKEHIFPKKELFDLRDSMIRLGARDYDFLTDERLHLIEYLYNSDIVILHLMKNEDCVSACNIILKRSFKEFMFWIDLFDDSKMINIASYIRFIEAVSLESSVVINFGRGRYFYKVSNFSPIFDQLYQISIYNSKWGRLQALIINYIRDALISMYKKIKA